MADKKIKGYTEQERYLAYLMEAGVHDRYGHKGEEYINNIVIPRIQEELRIITKMGFSEYFLILHDIVKYCKNNDIAVGPARGSAGGSAVSYCLHITDIDPFQFDLIFERFLNDERYSPPDIDTDVCWNRRQEVIDYIVRKYGDKNMAQIVTFGTLSLKSLLDDLGRVYNIPKKNIEEVKDLIFEDGDKMTLSRALESDKFAQAYNALCEREPRIRQAMDRLEGIHRHASIHAGGVIIATEPISDLAPTYNPKGIGRMVVQYEMTELETIGLLKMDLLGLRTVTHVDWAEKSIRKWYDKDFYTRGYRLDDTAAFDIINAGNTAGIFQLEGSGITAFAQRMRIDNFNDIVALLALYRPGTLDSGSAEQYINRKNGKEPVAYPHPDLEPILRDTYGIIIYQEQVMSVFRRMAGYTLGQADMARKAMGKKNQKIMNTELEKFKTGALARGYDESTVQEISDLLATFARYGFNKSHAVAYAYLCYWTALIKAKYPDAFYSAWLNITDTADKQAWIIDHMLRDGVKLLPPDVNISESQFAITEFNVIRFGLQAIKGIGKFMVGNIITNREIGGNYKSYYDFCSRLPSLAVDKKEALIAAGAFDNCDDKHRGLLLHNARIINILAKKGDLIGDRLGEVAPLKPIEMAELEKQYINFYVTMDPIKGIQEEILMMGGTVGVPTSELYGTCLIGGRITNIHCHQTKKGDEMAFIEIDDGKALYSFSMFPEDWKKNQLICIKDSMVIVKVKRGNYKGQPSLNYDSGMQVIDINNRTETLVIHMGKPSPMQVVQLKGILDMADKGGSIVKLIIIQNGYQFKLKSKLYRIHITDDILNEIKNIFGSNSIKLEMIG